MICRNGFQMGMNKALELMEMCIILLANGFKLECLCQDTLSHLF